MTSRDIVEQSEKKALSFTDIKRMLGPASSSTKLIHYNDLQSATNIQQVFGPNKAVIILLSIMNKNAPTVGHWIAILSKGDIIEHFDSYGFSIDKELSITHEQPWLGQLLRSSDKKIIQSTRRYQQLREDVNTCGRWCVVRVKNFNKSNREFSNYISQLHEQPDVAVTMLTMHL